MGKGRIVIPARNGIGRKSDASMTSDQASEVFDTGHSQGEKSEGSDITSPDQDSDEQEGVLLSFRTR